MECTVATDPFLWDANAVAGELCSLARPCTQNPSGLAAKVRQNDIDGHTLLTYELVGISNVHELRNELFQTLDIKALKHKNALGEAIMRLRIMSPAFQQWKKDFFGDGDQDKRPFSLECHYSARMNPPSNQVSRPMASDENHDTDEGNACTTETRRSDYQARGKRKVFDTDDAAKNTNKSAAPFPPPLNLSAAASPLTNTAQDHSSFQPPQKKKRITPQLIQAKGTHSSPLQSATKTDTLGRASIATPDRNSCNRDHHVDDHIASYIGTKALSPSYFKFPAAPLTSPGREEGHTFSVPVPIAHSPGQRLAVYSSMKQRLARNNRVIYGAEKHKRENKATSSASESDKELALDDLPDELDEETLKEMEDEQADLQRLQQRHASRLVSSQRVRQLLDEETSLLIASWKEKKLPRYQTKAHSLWLAASKGNKKMESIHTARSMVNVYNDMVRKFESEILGAKWEKEQDVRKQAECLQQSIENRLYQSWVAEMLLSNIAPPKQPVVFQKRPRQPKPQMEPSDDEVLTSSDEENFIVGDEDPNVPDRCAITTQTRPATTRITRSSSPIHPNSPAYIDLTQLDSSAPPSPTPIASSYEDDLEKQSHGSSMNIIKQDAEDEASLPRPSPNQLSQPLNLSWEDKYREIEKIVKHSPSYWSKQKERYALLITLLWNLEHSRRSAIFKMMERVTQDVAFDLTVTRHLSKPIEDLEQLSRPGAETLAFDTSRLLLCFIRVKNCRESRFADSKPADVRKLREQQDGKPWLVFCTFVSRIAPLFPKDSQIYRPDHIDDEMSADDFIGDGVEQVDKHPGKTPCKVIIRDREAVNLREREQRRAAEMNDRKRRLRAGLGDTPSLSGDKSRLIINESKQDGQPLIYINEHIGSRIKDHQVEGVRFMWNQIVEGQDVRQGCLLSHSMGLGKTMQVITLLVAIQESKESSDPGVVAQVPEDLRTSKALVLCPPTLVNNWYDEILLWDKDGVLGTPKMIVSKLPKQERTPTLLKWSREGGILLLAYSMLNILYEVESNEKLEKRILTEHPNIIIADEAHTFKDSNSNIAKACAQFKSSTRIAMTGSPLANNIGEYFSMIDWVAPNFLGPLAEFREIYSNPIQKGVARDSQPHDKRRALQLLYALKKAVTPKVHRATTQTCEGNLLPPKREFVLFLRLKPMQTKFYNQYWQARGQEIKQASQLKHFGPLHDLFLLCNHPACFLSKGPDRTPLPGGIVSEMSNAYGLNLKSPELSAKVEVLQQILDQARIKGDKVLVFSHSKPTLGYLEDLCKSQDRLSQRLDGQTPIHERQDHVKRFNNGKCDVYLISTRAGGVGLNFQGANRVVIFDFWYNPVHEQQAIGRAYRIGQTKPVTVYHLVTAGTSEEDLHDTTIFKAQLASRVVDKKNPISWGKRVAEMKPFAEVPTQEDLSKYNGKEDILDKLIAYSDEHDTITKIIPTDTFEEEDENALLSAKELEETQQLVRMGRLRTTDPVAYLRLKELQGEEHRHRASQASQRPITTASAAAPSSMLQMDGASDPLAPAAVNARPVSRAYQPSIDPRVALEAKKMFRKRLLDKVEKMPSAHRDRLKAAWVEAMDEHVASIERARNSTGDGGLPDIHRWEELGDLARHENFVVALVQGLFHGEELAIGNLDKVEDRIATLGVFGQDQFWAAVNQTRGRYLRESLERPCKD